MNSATVGDVENYKLLRTMLECNELEIEEWEFWKNEHAGMEKLSLDYFNELRRAGVESAERREQNTLKIWEYVTNIIDQQLSRLKNEQIGVIERMQAAEEAVLSLPDNLKETLWYLCIEGWEPEQVAQALNCKLSVIERRQKEGLQALRDSAGK